MEYTVYKFFFIMFLHLNSLIYIQGGAIRLGLLVVGPLPSPLGGCEGQDEQNPLGGGPSNGVNGG
jgi:hypothetical protein